MQMNISYNPICPWWTSSNIELEIFSFINSNEAEGNVRFYFMNFILILRSPEQALELIDIQASSTPLSVLSTEKYKGKSFSKCNAFPLKHSVYVK